MTPTATTDPAEHIMPGSLWPRETVKGQAPPLVPALPPGDDASWDSNILGHFPRGHVNDAERRHSGVSSLWKWVSGCFAYE